MALTSWTGLYTDVVRDLMLRRKEPELLLLLAIAGHCDPFGFCFPGKKALMTLRHCGEDVFVKRRQWLVDEGYLKYQEVYNPRRRQMDPDYQVSPRILYLREDIHDYCAAVFDGIQERDYGLEKDYCVTLFSTKVSQPEEPDSEPETETRFFEPDAGTSSTSRHNNQIRALNNEQAQPTTMRNRQRAPQKPAQPAAAPERQTAQHSEGQSARRDYDALFHTWYYTDDETLAREVKTAVATSISQARSAVKEYPREWVVHWALKTLQRRDKGELTNPGAWFFKTLRQKSPDKESERLDTEEREQYAEMEI